MFVILMGAQGSGKGTQAALLGPELHLVPIATGDLFRRNIAEKTELGVKVKSIIDAGNLVPDELTNAIVESRIAELATTMATDASVKGAMFDGFPRTAGQAQALDDMLAAQGHHITAVTEIVVPREKLIDRLAGRRTCPTCGTVYHIEADPPKVEGICDKDGSALIQRDDDQPASIARRLALYDELTAPLLDYYRTKDLVYQVNGDQGVQDVHKDLLATIEQAAHVAGEKA